MINALPESVKKIASPEHQARTCALAPDETTLVIAPANALAPPDFSSRFTKPPMTMIVRITCTWVPAANSLSTWFSTALSTAANGL